MRKANLHLFVITLFFLLFNVCQISDLYAQSGVSVNTAGASADPSAMFDVSSINSGILIPRMTEAQKNTISNPATGLLVYQTDGTAGFYYYSGTVWKLAGDDLGNHTAIQDIDLNNNKVINLADPVASGDGVNVQTLQSGALVYAFDAGTSSAYLVNISPAINSYIAGMTVNFIAANASTGASTINVNGLGNKNIKKQYNVDLAANDILAGQAVTLMYDGTNFQMLSQSGSSGASTPSVTFSLSNSLSGGMNIISCPAAGNTNSSPVTIYCNFLSGTRTNVVLSVSGLPANVTASFDPSGSIPDFTSNLTFTASGAVAGNYTITVTGTAGSNTATTSFTLRIGKRRVFVTSTTHSVGGGMAAIDGNCQARANAGSLGGIYKGFFGLTTRAPYSVIMDGPYQLVNGNAVANSRADFFDGSIQNSISVTELSGSYSGQVATASRWYGTISYGSGGEPMNCGDFMISSGSILIMGYSYSTGSDWADCNCGPNCSGTYHLYCFEQ